MTRKDKATHSHLAPGMTEKTADFLEQKREEQQHKSALHQYPPDDKRRDARREHTNGSTPRRDQ